MVNSYVIDKVEIRESPIHGLGMFAINNIQKGEIVFIKGGHILRREQFYSSEKINSYLPIDDNFYIAALTEDEELQVKLYNNHSCDPNCGLRGEITFVAIRDIKKNEELTCDYAFIDNEDYKFECYCGSFSCRHHVTGRDWKLPEIQNKYKEYFATYLKEKLKNKT